MLFATKTNYYLLLHLLDNASPCRQAIDMNPLTAPKISAQSTPQKTVPQTSPPRESRDQSQTTPTKSPAPERHTPASTNEFIRHQPPPPAFRPLPEFHPRFFTNGNGLFRPGSPSGYQHPVHHHLQVLHSPIQPAALQNGKYFSTLLVITHRGKSANLYQSMGDNLLNATLNPGIHGCPPYLRLCDVNVKRISTWITSKYKRSAL